MKYRIKIVKYKSGKILYYPQILRFFGWRYLWESFLTKEINESINNPLCEKYTREDALRTIDSHYEGSGIISINIEYINK